MEILNILYNNNFIAFYLIGAILVVILIFIVISSMTTTPKEIKKEEILEDPTEENVNLSEFKIEPIKEVEEYIKEESEPSKINDIVEDLYQQKIQEDKLLEEDNQDLNSFLEEFEVPENIIEEVNITENIEENEQPVIETTKKHEKTKSEDIETMLKRLYELRQSENNNRKNVILNEIYDLKKQVDETIKANYDYSINYENIDTKALADYYLFNEDIEFPKLK